jgi:FlaA1/EpsC-like NDP-sugar epimerase
MNGANKVKVFLLFLGDAIMLYASLFAALFIRYQNAFYFEFVRDHALPFTVVFVLWLILFYIAGLYDLRRLRNNLDFIKTLFLTLVINAVIAVLLFYLIPAFGITPKTNLLIFIVIFAVVEIFWRRVANRWMTFGEAPNKIVLVGNGFVAEEVKKAITRIPSLAMSSKRNSAKSGHMPHPMKFGRQPKRAGSTWLSYRTSSSVTAGSCALSTNFLAAAS